MSSSLGDNKLLFGPKHNIYTFFIILFGLFDLILLFVYQTCHVNCETENKKKIIFKKNYVTLLSKVIFNWHLKRSSCWVFTFFMKRHFVGRHLECGILQVTFFTQHYIIFGRKPRSSGYGRRLTSKRSWVRIHVLDTGWTFFTYIVVKKLMFVSKDRKLTIKEAGDGPF